MKVTVSISSFLLICSLAACKKNNTGGETGPLDGTWTISSMQETYSRTVAYPGPGYVDSTALFSNYTSANSTGTLVISSGVMTPKGLACTGPNTDYFTEYQNNIRVTNDTSTGNATQLASSNVVFELVGTDSIYFADGPILGVSVSGTGLGGTYTLRDNVMTMVLDLDQIAQVSNFNETGTLRDLGSATITMTRQ